MAETPHTPLASILMPVYNQERFLGQSLASAQAQTLGDCEIVCIDDGSTDSSPALLRKAAEKDPRIRVIRQKNAGVSAARNRALDEARGKYVFFCDPDDEMDPRLLETALNALKRYKADLCGFKFRTISESGRPLRSHYRHNMFQHVQVLTPREAIREQLQGRIGGYLWAFVAERSVYERSKVRFPVGRRIEDEARICQILGSANRIVRLPRVLYSYRLHGGSLLGSPSTNLAADWFRAQKDRRDWIIAHYPSLAGYVRLKRLDLLGNLDYESMRQSLVFGLGMDADSVARRKQKLQKNRERHHDSRFRR